MAYHHNTSSKCYYKGMWLIMNNSLFTSSICISGWGYISPSDYMDLDRIAGNGQKFARIKVGIKLISDSVYLSNYSKNIFSNMRVPK